MQRISSGERHREDIVQRALDGRRMDYITEMLGRVDGEADIAQRTLHGAEMANRTNKPNRTFSRLCSVCSSSAPHQTEPNNTLVRFVFGRISNIDVLVRFCSSQTRTEQCLCSVRVRQVRTTLCTA